MTLRHLQIFVEVYQSLSITRAAERLYISQPAVSQAIADLEKYYGIRLFDRINKRIHRTPNSDAFYGYARHITSLFDELERSMRNGDAAGTLHIGSSITIGNFLLPGLVQRFRQTYPEIDVKITISNTDNIQHALMENRIDFALMEGSAAYPELVQTPFYQDRLTVIAAPRHPFTAIESPTLADLAAQPLILREQGSAGRNLLEGMMLLSGLEISPAWESTSTQAIVRAVSLGLGVSVLPRLLVEKDVREGSVVEVPVAGLRLQRTYFLVHHRHKYITTFARRFMDACLSLGTPPPEAAESD